MEIQNNIQGWAVVEIMGHQTVSGQVRTEAFGSVVMLRVDTPNLPAKTGEIWGEPVEFQEEPGSTHYVGMGSVYRLTLTSEEIARDTAERGRKLPTKRLALQLPPAPYIGGVTGADDLFEDDFEDVKRELDAASKGGG